MLIVKVLKRKDAASITVAVVLGLIVSQVLPNLVAQLSGVLSGLNDNQYYTYANPSAGWQGRYLQPVISAILQVIVLELLIRLVVAIRPVFVSKR